MMHWPTSSTTTASPGRMIFDPNQKNVAPMYLGTVHNGAITYRVATMEPPAVGQTALARQEVSEVQRALQAPYAQIGEEPIAFTGPRAPDLEGGALDVILFGAHAATVAESPEVQESLASATHGRAFHIVPVDSDQNWGAASTQLVHALMNAHALAVVALDRNAAHLAEQLALKSFVPVLAVSDDKSLTSTNVPWIFRMPYTTTPAAAIRVLVAATARSGPNPGRLRDVLAAGTAIAGIAFQPSGEPKLR